MATPAGLDTVAVIGNGLIGHGVAQVFAAAGKQVRLVGRSQASLERAVARIRQSLTRSVAHGLTAAADAELFRLLAPLTGPAHSRRVSGTGAAAP
jgi:3-hydroxyacyl-CoA dehydrogenase